jgi:hypothetical protein
MRKSSLKLALQVLIKMIKVFAEKSPFLIAQASGGSKTVLRDAWAPRLNPMTRTKATRKALNSWRKPSIRANVSLRVNLPPDLLLR